MTIPAAGRPRALTRLWWSSLPLRVIALTLAGSALVLVLGGVVLMNQATSGILAGKRASAVAEAATALDRMQSQLRTNNLGTTPLYERLGQLADEAGAQPNQYRVVIQGPVSSFVSPGIGEQSVPDSLVKAVTSGDGMYVTPTLVDWSDPSRQDEPGLAVGATLQAPAGAQGYPIYFVFPETRERQTIAVVQRAVLTASGLLLALLAAVGWLVSRQVLGPVRQASIAASRIAAGSFEERIPVRGTDDLASLATSLNDMAGRLTSQISQLEDLSRVQQQFVQDVSHELRTPLTTVRMAADLLYDGRDELDPFAARSTELMHDELDRFEAMLADLLEISRFDAGAAVLALEEHDIVDLVRREMQAQQPLADRNGCSLVLTGEVVALADVDSRRITRIVRNLLTNAIEHSEGRPVVVTVASDQTVVALSVRDHGVGFPAHAAEQVFGRFWRADPSRTRAVGGSGLGLAIALEDATLHRGWLKAWGRPHHGAQFLLVLPRDERCQVDHSPLPLVPREVP